MSGMDREHCHIDHEGGSAMVAGHVHDTADEIVRSLAKRGPFITRDDAGRTDVCADCEAVDVPGPDTSLSDPANHKPTCLWRLAKEWVASQTMCDTAARHRHGG